MSQQIDLIPTEVFPAQRTRISGIKKWLAKPHRHASTLRLSVRDDRESGELTTLMEWSRAEIVPALAEDIAALMDEQAREDMGPVSAKLTQHADEDGRALATKRLEWRPVGASEDPTNDGSPRAWGIALMGHVEAKDRLANAAIGMALSQMNATISSLLKVHADTTQHLLRERARVDEAREAELLARVEAAQTAAESLSEGGQDAEILRETIGALKMAFLHASQQPKVPGE